MSPKLITALLAVGTAGALLAIDWFTGGFIPHMVYGTSTLDLDSSPVTARVMLNRRLIGTTPLRHDLMPGEVLLEFEHVHHESVRRRISLERGEIRRIRIDFEPAYGDLSILTNPRGARVTLDGRNLSESPLELTGIDTGEHQVRVALAGWVGQTATVSVYPNRTTAHVFELQRVRHGTLYVEIQPPTALVQFVHRDDAYQHTTPIPAGDYLVRVSAEGYVSQERMMEVRPGPNQHKVTLQRIFGRLSIRVQPPHASVIVSYTNGDVRHDRPYVDAMTIPAGPLTVRATAFGYRRHEFHATLTGAGLSRSISLEKFDVRPGRVFRDTLSSKTLETSEASDRHGPKLVVIPAGHFTMGSDDGAPDEGPAHEVSIGQPFAIGVFETTREEMALYLNRGFEGNKPATQIDLSEVDGYLRWLSEQTGYRYRLPSEAEWEYAARAGGESAYYFGDDALALCEHANIADVSGKTTFLKDEIASCNDTFASVAPVGQFPPNGFGLHDTIGNVEEWVADCWHFSFDDAPQTAEPWGAGCSGRVVRGGAFNSSPNEARITFRSMGSSAGDRRGFRVVREL
ncbi:MAG: SUMF1/EgtB/PvdO family nonheme iron enzyme [Gammaproteobacteria bacterium]|nr:SUMF1/EgtB/PvdO family nonheme iron enzyme [Gammaproteobacteria bacterium]